MKLYTGCIKKFRQVCIAVDDHLGKILNDLSDSVKYSFISGDISLQQRAILLFCIKNLCVEETCTSHNLYLFFFNVCIELYKCNLLTLSHAGHTNIFRYLFFYFCSLDKHAQFPQSSHNRVSIHIFNTDINDLKNIFKKQK